jgi:LDH2 family malate/lactate/ureidoglycolate dehydrogenase
MNPRAAPTVPTRVTAEHVREFSTSVLERCGLSAEDARIVADALAWADLRAIAPQGIAKLPLLVRRLRSGGARPDAVVKVVSGRGAFLRLDAGRATGHVAGVRAMRAAIVAARTNGVGLAVVGNTDSGSAMGYYASLAATDGFIGLAINNTYPLMPPHGGTTRVVGNQAFAIAVPRDGTTPLLFDSALSALSHTGIEEMRDRGEPLPKGLALDAAGLPTTDHVAAIAGLIKPVGGHRGFGLALMWEVLTGVLSGNERFASRITPIGDVARPQSVAHCYLAIDPRVVMPLDAFTARVSALVDAVHASPPAEGTTRVFVPGEQGDAIAERRAREGIEVNATKAAELEALGRELGVAW